MAGYVKGPKTRITEPELRVVHALFIARFESSSANPVPTDTRRDPAHAFPIVNPQMCRHVPESHDPVADVAVCGAGAVGVFVGCHAREDYFVV